MVDIKTLPMKLIDRNPSWKMTHDGNVYGIVYDCPCGLPVYDPDVSIAYDDCCPSGGRQIVPTKTTFTRLPVCADSVKCGWDLTGDSFDNITLSPPIHQVGHWHGFLRNGMLESC